MIKRLLPLTLLLALVLALVALPSGTASAHVLATDGDIGAVLHINPDDNPVSGTPVNYDLAFDDTSGKLQLVDCDCTVTVQENGKTISAKPLNVSGGLNSSNTVTFPKAAVYSLEVTGKPKVAGAFQPFTIDYTVRVTSGSAQDRARSIPVLLWIGIGGIIGLIMLAAYAAELSYSSGHSGRKRNSKGEF